MKKAPLNFFAIFFFTTLFLVLALNALKILPWNIWGILWRFWPIFLLMAILQFMARKRGLWGFVVSGLGIGIITALLLFSIASVSDKFTSSLIKFNPYINKIRKVVGLESGDKLSSNIVIEDKFPNLTERKINIRVAAGEFNLSDNPNPPHLVANSEYYQEFGKPEINLAVEDGTLNLNFETEKNLKPLFGVAQDTKYDISIGNPNLPTSLELNAGATVFDAKFQNIKLKSLQVNVGAGNAKVSVSKRSMVSESINTNVGAGTLKLILPFDEFFKINYIVGAGVLYIDDQKFIRSGSFTTANFGIKENPIPVNVTIGAGTIYIDTSGNI